MRRSAEVYSLQLVVGMRTAEVRGLREKLTTSEQQLEDAAVTKTASRRLTPRSRTSRKKV